MMKIKDFLVTATQKNLSFKKLDELGVLSGRLDADNYEIDLELKKIREDRGYTYTDMIEVCQEKLPNYEEKIKNFYEEHLHTDEEIHYCLASSGYFDVHDRDESWIRIWVKKGALIVLPAGIYHRFTLYSNNYIKVMWGPGAHGGGVFQMVSRKLIQTNGNLLMKGFRGGKDISRKIKRRKSAAAVSSSNQGFESCVEIGTLGLDTEIEQLRPDKQVLMLELVKLRQQQHNTNLYITQMEQRLKGTELKQHQTMSFLAKVINNPDFLHQILQHEEIEEVITRKRRKRIDHGGDGSICLRLGPLKETANVDISSPFDVDQAMEESLDNMGEEIIYDEKTLILDKIVEDDDDDEGFWEDLVVDDQLDDEDQIMDVFSDQMGFLNSSA